MSLPCTISDFPLEGKRYGRDTSLLQLQILNEIDTRIKENIPLYMEVNVKWYEQLQNIFINE